MDGKVLELSGCRPGVWLEMKVANLRVLKPRQFRRLGVGGNHAMTNARMKSLALQSKGESVVYLLDAGLMRLKPACTTVCAS